MLSEEQIAENLMSDVYSYKEYIQSLVVAALKNDPSQKVYWDAWFRGAEGKALEEADAGKVYTEVPTWITYLRSTWKSCKCHALMKPRAEI